MKRNEFAARQSPTGKGGADQWAPIDGCAAAMASGSVII